MLQRATLRPLQNAIVARRAFHMSRRLGKQTHVDQFFHYPEGPRSNLPFNPLTKFFAIRYWSFFGFGFALPFISAWWMTVKEQ